MRLISPICSIALLLMKKGIQELSIVTTTESRADYDCELKVSKVHQLFQYIFFHCSYISLPIPCSVGERQMITFSFIPSSFIHSSLKKSSPMALNFYDRLNDPECFAKNVSYLRFERHRLQHMKYISKVGTMAFAMNLMSKMKGRKLRNRSAHTGLWMTLLTSWNKGVKWSDEKKRKKEEKGISKLAPEVKAKRKGKMEEKGTSLKGQVPWNKGEKYSNEN